MCHLCINLNYYTKLWRVNNFEKCVTSYITTFVKREIKRGLVQQPVMHPYIPELTKWFFQIDSAIYWKFREKSLKSELNRDRREVTLRCAFAIWRREKWIKFVKHTNREIQKINTFFTQKMCSNKNTMKFHKKISMWKITKWAFLSS